MKPKPKPTYAPSLFKDRMGLGAYLTAPAAYPSSIVLAHSPSFVVIHDKFPKATVHTLLLPRSPAHSLQHPFDAFHDPTFLAEVVGEVERLKGLVARELQRVLGRGSRSEGRRQRVLDGEEDLEAGDAGDGGGKGELPPGRDWSKDIICGVHAVPSMSHLHIHVLSRDMHSPCLKHRKHYNSFTTPFLVDVADFPLRDDDPRRDTRAHPYLKSDLTCWRCGRNFGNRFKELKEHLETEYEEWRRE